MNLYATFLKKSKEAIALLELPFKVRQEQKKVELKIIELEQEVASLELSVQEKKSVYPLNLDGIIQAQNELELTKRKLTQVKALEHELFHDEVQEG